MPARPVSEVIKARSPYKIVDLPPTTTSERWGYSRALRARIAESGEIMPIWYTLRLFSIEPKGGMTEMIQIDRHDKKSRSDLDLRIIKGVGKIVKYNFSNGSVEVSDLHAQKSRVIRDGDAFVLANTSPELPFVAQLTEMPTLNFGETRSLGSASISHEKQNLPISDAFYEAVGQLAAGRY